MSISDAEVREILESAVASMAARFGTRRAWSDAHWIDPSYTVQVLSGARRASDNILDALGLIRTEVDRIEPIQEGAYLGRVGQELLDARIEDMLAKHGNQARLAEHLGVSRAFVNKVVKGKAKPSPSMLREMGLVIIREHRIVRKQDD